MKRITTLLCLMSLFHFSSFAQTDFNLEPTQSMLMTGKGPGQDATINPFKGETCYAIVENTGKISFSIRIQQQGKIKQEITIESGEIKKIKLLAEDELYLDPNPVGTTSASVDYQKIE